VPEVPLAPREVARELLDHVADIANILAHQNARSVPIRALHEDGAKSLTAIADGLNARGILSARGNGKWSSVQVRLPKALGRIPRLPLLARTEEVMRTCPSVHRDSFRALLDVRSWG
jgi:hypothetical protein